MAQVNAVDYEGFGLSPIPDHALGMIIAETSRRSAFLSSANKEYDVETLGLDKGSVATYDILTEINVGGFSKSNENGEIWQPDNPFRSGEVTLCNDIKIEKKFSRTEAKRLSRSARWDGFKTGFESAIGDAVSNEIEHYGLRNLLAKAYRANTGVNAGKITHSVNLGTVANPIKLGGTGLTANKLMQRMKQVLNESIGNASDIVVYSSLGVQNALLDDQSGLSHCNLYDNPMVTGVTSPVLGMDLLATVNAPFVINPVTGKRVEYVIMANAEHVVAPIDVLYLDWQIIKNDIYLVGSISFEGTTLTGASVVVACVELD